MGVIKLGGDLITGAGAVDINASPYIVENVVRPMPPIDLATKAPSGGDGSVFIESALRCPTIDMTIWVMGTSEQRRAKMRTLAGLISTKTATRLEFGDDSGLYYHVVPTGDRTPQDFIDSSCIDVRFESLYPYMFGEQKTYTVGTTNVLINNAGTYRPLLVYSGSVTTDSDSRWSLFGSWGMSLSYTMAAASTSYVVRSINVDTRQSKFGNQQGTPSLNSTWGDGNFTLASTRISRGSGTLTLTMTERYI